MSSAGRALASPVARAQDGSTGSAIKATYLYKIPPFVEWPNGAMENVFTVRIVGIHPFGATLDRAFTGQLIKDRQIVVRRQMTISGDGGCQIVYATGSPAQSVPSILAAPRGRPVISVTDGERDILAKGVLNFMIVDNRDRRSGGRRRET